MRWIYIYMYIYVYVSMRINKYIYIYFQGQSLGLFLWKAFLRLVRPGEMRSVICYKMQFRGWGVKTSHFLDPVTKWLRKSPKGESLCFDSLFQSVSPYLANPIALVWSEANISWRVWVMRGICVLHGRLGSRVRQNREAGDRRLIGLSRAFLQGLISSK